MDKIIKWFFTKDDKKEKTDNFIIGRLYTGCSPVCECICSYKGFCQNIPDPRDITNSKSSLLDFCSECDRNYKGEGDFITDDDLKETLIPAEGSIEEFFEKQGVDLYQICLKKNPKVELKTIIDKVCKGWCSSYDPSYCNCKSTNYTCILKNLFEEEK